MEQLTTEELRALVRRRLKELGVRRETITFYDVSHATFERFLAGKRVRPEQLRRLALAVGIELGSGPVEVYEIDHIQTPEEFEERWLEHMPDVVRDWLTRQKLRAVR